MPIIDYPRVIEEDQEDLEKLEKRHRYTHLFHRVKMLRLLKSGRVCRPRPGRRGFGLQLAPVPEVVLRLPQGLCGGAFGQQGRRARPPKELVADEAWRELEEAMKEGEITTIAQAHRFLGMGVADAPPESVGALLRRRKVKLKTGRPRHENADPQEQEAFKKTSPTPSAGAASVTQRSH
jgi:hypothetical protein